MSCETLCAPLEALRARYNRREFVHPDPLEFLYRYDDARDREVVGLIAASLAYGRVKSILRSVGRVLERMKEPARFLRETPEDDIRRAFADFRHRVTSGETLALLLIGMKRVVADRGSLEACFRAGFHEGDETVLPGLTRFVDALTTAAGACPVHLLSSPARGSACKRLHLYLRWMVRRDEVDPGGWTGVSPAKLIVPLDVHMHRVGLALGFTRRKQADGLAAREVTAGFREIAPDDPVRYDFALTRLGIRKEGDLKAFLEGLSGKGIGAA
jgi:uncharacterized protein (TIGR02757 family)